MIYYTADTHFGHDNIIKFCNRPFADTDEMNKAMIEMWNSRIKNDDLVYIIGDMFFKSKTVVPILERLKGKKYLILGNHDYWVSKVDVNKYFVGVDKIYEGYDGEQRICLCHFPLMTWNKEKKTLMIHGHIHNDTDFEFWELIRNNESILNAGADINGLVPVTLEELIENNRIFKSSTRLKE